MARRGKDTTDHGDGPPADEGWGTHVHGTRPIAGAQPGGTPGYSSGPTAEKQPGRGRTWLILLMSFLVQLVVVLAAGNTAVVRNGLEYRGDHDNLLGAFATLPSVYAWRLTPPDVDTAHAYAASLFSLLALFVVAALLTLALVRGPVTFWRAFVAVTLSVLAGTVVAGMVRRGILDAGNYDAVGGKAVAVVFNGSGFEVVAGLVTGLLAGLVAAIVAVVSRRPAEAVVPFAAPEPAPYVEPAAPPPWHGDDAPPPAYSATPRSFQKSSSDDAQATTRFAAAPSPAPSPAPTPTAAPADAGDGATTRLRRDDGGQYGPPTVVGRQRADEADTPAETPAKEPAAEEQRTTQFPAQRRPDGAGTTDQSTQAMPAAFPRPPDDEDLGHQPDDD